MSAVSYLKCGCVIRSDGGVEGREYCSDCTAKLLADGNLVKQARIEERQRIMDMMALERCDPDVMPSVFLYFEDYYWLPKRIGDKLKRGEEVR